MKVLQAKFPQCCSIRTQFVGDYRVRDVSLFLQKFPHQFQGRTLVSPRLGKDFKNLAFVIYSAPEISPLATNANKDLIKMPCRRRPWPVGSDIGCKRRTKFQYPSAYSFIAGRL